MERFILAHQPVTTISLGPIHPSIRLRNSRRGILEVRRSRGEVRPLHDPRPELCREEAPEPMTSKGGLRAFDPLWADDEGSHEWDGEKTTFWWEPFWMTVSYWDKQMDQPFRPDRCAVLSQQFAGEDVLTTFIGSLLERRCTKSRCSAY